MDYLEWGYSNQQIPEVGADFSLLDRIHTKTVNNGFIEMLILRNQRNSLLFQTFVFAEQINELVSMWYGPPSWKS